MNTKKQTETTIGQDKPEAYTAAKVSAHSASADATKFSDEAEEFDTADAHLKARKQHQDAARKHKSAAEAATAAGFGKELKTHEARVLEHDSAAQQHKERTEACLNCAGKIYDSKTVKCSDGTTISLSDLQAQLQTAALEDGRFNKAPAGSKASYTPSFGVWCADVDQEGDAWFGIIQASDGKLYRVPFALAAGEVELGEGETVVVRKTQYVNASYGDFFYGGVKVLAGTSEGVRKAWQTRKGGEPYDKANAESLANKDVEHHRMEAYKMSISSRYASTPKIASNAAERAGEHASRATAIASEKNTEHAHLNAAEAHEHAARAFETSSQAHRLNDEHSYARYHADSAAAHKVMARQHINEATKSTIKATSTEATRVITASVTGQPRLHEHVEKMRKSVDDAVKDDPRFGGGSGPLGQPYAVDILVPDEDGKHHAVIRKGDGKLVKHGFDYKPEEGAVLDTGDPEPTECTQVYTRMVEERDALITAGAPIGNKNAAKAHAASAIAHVEQGHFKSATEEANAASDAADNPEGHRAAAEAHFAVSQMHSDKADAMEERGNGGIVSDGHVQKAQLHEDKAIAHLKAARVSFAKAKATDPTATDALITAATPKAAAAATASKAATAATLAANDKAGHERAFHAHTDASDAHLVALAEMSKAGVTKDEMKPHVEQMAKHDAQAAEHHRKISELKGGKFDPDDGKAEPQVAPVKSSAMNSANFVHCRAGAEIQAAKGWSLDKPASFMWMPAGVSTVQAGYGDKSSTRPIELTVECDADTANVVNASMAEWKEKMPKRDLFMCIEHREEESAGNPLNFEWKDDGENSGVYCNLLPSGQGVRNVNERIHKAFSPSFTTDAEYHKSVCADCDKGFNTCKCGGTLTFPDGVRGSESNPAKVTAIGFSVGSLTNKPAFKNIAAVTARQRSAAARKPLTVDEIFASLKPKRTEPPTLEDEVDKIFAGLARQASPPAKT